MHLQEQAQHKATKTMKGLEHLSHEERLRELGMSSFMTKKIRGILPICITTWWEGRKSEKRMKSLFSLVPTGRTRSNRNKWKHICENACSVWAEEKCFYSEDGQTLEKAQTVFGSPVQYICNCWYVWRWLKGKCWLRCTNSKYSHDQETSLSEYETP